MKTVHIHIGPETRMVLDWTAILETRRQGKH